MTDQNKGKTLKELDVKPGEIENNDTLQHDILKTKLTPIFCEFSFPEYASDPRPEWHFEELSETEFRKVYDLNIMTGLTSLGHKMSICADAIEEWEKRQVAERTEYERLKAKFEGPALKAFKQACDDQ